MVEYAKGKMSPTPTSNALPVMGIVWNEDSHTQKCGIDSGVSKSPLEHWTCERGMDAYIQPIG